MPRAGTKVKWTLEIPESGNRIFIVKGETRLSAATLTEAQQILDELNRQLKVIESVSRQVTRLTDHRDALDKSLKHHKQLFAESCRVLATGRPSAAKHPAQMTQAETSEARHIYFNKGKPSSITEDQQKLIAKCKALGHGYAKFATSVESSGRCSVRQQETMQNMISTAEFRKNNPFRKSSSSTVLDSAFAEYGEGGYF